MVKFRINKKVVEKYMAQKQINYVELAKVMKITTSKMSYMVNSGGKSYARDLSKALNCKPEELITVKGEA